MQSDIEKHFAVSGFVMNQEKTKLLMVYHKKLNIPEKGDKPAHIHMDFIFICIADEEIPKKQEAEVADVKWMTWEEVLESDIFESIKEFARKMVDEKSKNVT